MDRLPDNEFRDLIVDAARRLHPRLVRYTSRFFGGRQSCAQDVVQHAFLQLCRIAPDSRPGKLDSWLFRVCRNRAIDEQRRQSRFSASRNGSIHGDVIDESGAERDEVAERELYELVRRRIESLPDSQREAIDLWSGGFSYSEISEVMDRPENSIRVLVHRAIARLRRDVGESRESRESRV